MEYKFSPVILKIQKNVKYIFFVSNKLKNQHYIKWKKKKPLNLQTLKKKNLKTTPKLKIQN